MTEQTTTAESAARSAERVEHLLHPRTAAEQLRSIFAGREYADDGRIAALAREVLADLDAATVTHWTDPGGGVYDLSAAWRDAEGAYWRHAGWVGLPGEPRVPLMLWSPSRDLPEGGIRRMSDLATLRAVIDDCGPLTAVRDVETGGGS